jgi:8-oxo-dGTP pyrophosphatase MutT (NUDIX family)
MRKFSLFKYTISGGEGQLCIKWNCCHFGGDFINIQEIFEIFSHRKGEIIGRYRKSAVMILLNEHNGELQLIFEKRAHTLRSQPGDICFPGGRMEEGEKPRETAVRETKEELNLDDEDIEVLGEMDYFISPYGNIIYPFVGIIHKSNLSPNPEEVDHVFKVPLNFFLTNDPQCYEIGVVPKINEDFPYHLIKGGKNYKFSKGKLNQYFYIYNGYVIWGFTALVIKSFIDIIKRSST